MNNPKKIFVSKGLRGQENPEAYHARCIEAVKQYYAGLGEEIEILESTKVSNTFDSSDIKNRIHCLGNTIANELAYCDVAVFMDNWQNYDGCRCEQYIAMRYGIECIHLGSQIRSFNIDTVAPS